MNLEELLGDAYKEGMTFDEVKTALSGKKLADLSTGNYVNKEMATKEKNDLQNSLNQQIEDLQNQLNAKLTDDEKNAKANEAKDKEIERLLGIIKQNNVNANKSNILVSTADIRNKIGIKEDDNDFNSFVDLITLEDSNNNKIVSSYLVKILNEAYDKGVKDTTKEQISKNNSLQIGKDGKVEDDDNNIGARLGKKNRENFENQMNKKSSFFA